MSGDGTIYAAYSGSAAGVNGSVRIFATNGVSTTIPLIDCKHPNDVALDEDKQQLFVISVFDRDPVVIVQIDLKSTNQTKLPIREKIECDWQAQTLCWDEKEKNLWRGLIHKEWAVHPDGILNDYSRLYLGRLDTAGKVYSTNYCIVDGIINGSFLFTTNYGSKPRSFWFCSVSKGWAKAKTGGPFERKNDIHVYEIGDTGYGDMRFHNSIGVRNENDMAEPEGLCRLGDSIYYTYEDWNDNRIPKLRKLRVTVSDMILHRFRERPGE